MKKLYCLLIAQLFFAPLWANTGICENTSLKERIFEIDGRKRLYYLHLPAKLSTNVPLVFTLHGYGGTAKSMIDYAKMNEVADKNGFAVCYPQGFLGEDGKNSWNARYSNDAVDDVKFLTELAKYLQVTFQLSTKNTFSTGMSNGADMSYMLACHAPDIFAAVAPVAGCMMQTTYEACNTVKTIPILEIHGDQDDITLWNGDENYSKKYGAYLGTRTIIDFWTKKHKTTQIDIDTLADLDKTDGSYVVTEKHFGGQPNNQVWLYKLVGGKHDWPGTWGNQDIQTAEVVWDFFKQFLQEETTAAQLANRPNILLIFTDDLGYGDLSIQGATDLKTPNIDAIAQQGMTFTQFYANSPVCSPSRASLLTGKYPDMVGVPGVIRQIPEQSWGYFDEKAITMPQLLQAAGYHTGMVGKWHLGYESPNIPNDKGFQHFKGFLGDMMEDYWTHLRGDVNWMRDNRKEIGPEGHATDIFTDWAIDYLQERSMEEQPFFLYLSYNAPHFPIQPPADWLEKVQKRAPELEEKRAKNVAFIEHLDFNVGKVMKALEEKGLADNTLVIFTSDNGGAVRFAQSNAPLRGSKQQMFEGGIRVPFYAVWKDKIPAGSKSENVGMLMDLMPTFCEVAKQKVNHEIDGMSLLPTLLGQEQTTDDRPLFWVRREGWHYGGQAYYAARYKGHKILQNSAYEPLQFFDIGEDMLEKAPLDIENDEDYKKLRNLLQEHIRKSGAVPWQKQ